VLAVRPHLARHVERAQQRERSPGDGRAGEVERDRDLAARVQAHASGRVEQRGELGEAVALAARLDAGELVA
jgi:hypothetical protein